MARLNPIFEEAYAACPRNEDGSVNEDALIAAIEARIFVDEESARREKAIRLVKRSAKPGGTQSKGQLTLPGMASYPYEPNRILKGAAIEGSPDRVIKQDEATVVFKVAQIDRGRENAAKVLSRLARDEAEVNGYKDYVQSERKGGNKKWSAITFGDYVRAKGLWRDSFGPE